MSQGRKIFFSQCSEGQHDTIITREAAYMHCYKDLDISSDQRKMTPKYSRSEKNTITSGFWTIKALILKWTTMCHDSMQGLKIGGKSGDLFCFVDLRYISGICRMADACKSVENWSVMNGRVFRFCLWLTFPTSESKKYGTVTTSIQTNLFWNKLRSWQVQINHCIWVAIGVVVSE